MLMGLMSAYGLQVIQFRTDGSRVCLTYVINYVYAAFCGECTSSQLLFEATIMKVAFLCTKRICLQAFAVFEF